MFQAASTVIGTVASQTRYEDKHDLRPFIYFANY